MGCCQGRVKVTQIQKEVPQTSLDPIDKAYFSSIASNYITNKQAYNKQAFNVTSV